MIIYLVFYILHRVNVRFWGCNAAGHNTLGGDAATAHLRALLLVGTRVSLRSRGSINTAGALMRRCCWPMPAARLQ